jgi:hypothetical protein
VPCATTRLAQVDRIVALHGDACTRMLTVQYRMNTQVGIRTCAVHGWLTHAQIMSFSSDALYDARLTADASVAAHTLAQLPDVAAVTHDNDDDDAANEDTYEADAMKPLLMIDTDGCDLREDGARDDYCF